MIYNTLHNRWLRLVAAVVGELICAAGMRLFIVPLGLYGGGLMGVCQLARTLMQTYMHLDFGSGDVAGVLYFILNVPILLFAYKTLGKHLVFKTLVCTVSYSLFYSMIPTPAAPVVDDYLTACLLGGILNGIGSGGGLDIVGLCLSKRGSRFTVGKFSLTFNFFLYAACLILFQPEIAIYSVIYNYFTAMVLDRMHQQNVSVEALIFTRDDQDALAHFIMEKGGASPIGTA
jgi:uncharacterized membrane-anchored protein YitT (DUF2179 family)